MGLPWANGVFCVDAGGRGRQEALRTEERRESRPAIHIGCSATGYSRIPCSGCTRDTSTKSGRTQERARSVQIELGRSENKSLCVDIKAGISSDSRLAVR